MMIMRMTIDLPEDVLRRAKSTAALRGIKIKDLITELVRSGLDYPPAETHLGQKRPIPVSIGLSAVPARSISSAVIEEALVREEIDPLGLDRPF